MVTILQTALRNEILWQKILITWCEFQSILFTKYAIDNKSALTGVISGAEQMMNNYLKQWRPVHWRIHTSPVNGLMIPAGHLILITWGWFNVTISSYQKLPGGHQSTSTRWTAPNDRLISAMWFPILVSHLYIEWCNWNLIYSTLVEDEKEEQLVHDEINKIGYHRVLIEAEWRIYASVN